MLDDFRLAARLTRKNPGTSLAIFFALALGIGGAATIFSLVNGVMLRPLPVREEDSLVRVFATDSGSQQDDVSMADYVDWKHQAHSFSDLAIYGTSQATLAGVTPERVVTVESEWNLLRLLGVKLLQGRDFRPEENQPGRGREAILSWAFWQKHFGGEPVIGHQLVLDERAYVVVGILPPDFTLLGQRDVFLPLPIDLTLRENRRGYHDYAVLARLAPGVSIGRANDELAAFSHYLATSFPKENTGVGAKAMALRDSLSGEGVGSAQSNVRPALLVLLAAVLCVLLIGCGNAANINLVRGWSRQREFAVRSALGASRLQLSRMVFAESLLLSSIAALAGIGIALALVRIFSRLPVAAIPRLAEVTVDWRVLLFALICALVAALASAFAPVLRLNSLHLNESLKEAGTRVTESRSHRRLRRIFVALQTALSALLLVECGLLTRSFANASRIDPAFVTDHLLTLYLSLPAARYGFHHPASTEPFVNGVLQRVRALAGVSSAAMASDLPLTGTAASGGVVAESRASADAQFWSSPHALLADVTPQYFKTFKIRFLAGRDFSNDFQKGNAPASIIVNRALARRLFPNQDPLGKRIAIASGERDWRRIVGVVADVPQTAIEKNPEPQVFFPLTQLEAPWLALAVRVQGDPLRYLSPLRVEVSKVDPAVAVFLPRTMDQIIEKQLLWRSLQAWVTGAFGFLAITLASVGVYAMIAYSTNQRRSEFGVRLALGASAMQLKRLILWDGMKPALLGALIGLVGGFAAARATASLLFGTSAADPLVYLATALILVLITLAACLVPATRAAALEPSKALRNN